MKVKPGDIIVTTSQSSTLAPGMVIDIYSSTPHLPRWARRKWWQDGDIMIFEWFFMIIGRIFYVYNETRTVIAVSGTTLTLR